MQARCSNIVLLLALSFLVMTCIEPFDPPKSGFENLLVIEALITDSHEPQTVHISRSIPLDTTFYVPENAATVKIFDDAGNEYRLEPAGNGIYTTPWPDFQAVPGRSYQLEVTTENGDLIRSDPVIMGKTPDIDSVSWEISSRLNDEGEDIPGVQIYVSTHDPENQTWYYHWQLEETWEFHAAYHSFYQWSANGWVEMRPENIYTCWSTHLPDKILIGSSSKLTEDVIARLPLLYVSSDASNRLSRKYSLLVKQYALSESAWLYWQQLKKMNENMGSLFAPQPTAVTGNLHDDSNKGKPVIGFFDVSAVKTKRIFISKEELEDMDVYSGYQGCKKDTLLNAQIPGYYYKDYMNPVDEVTNDMGFTIGYYVSSIECTDCRLHGTNIKPDFWE